MPNDAPIRLVYATFPSPDEAERIGRTLVDTQLAACVNILPGMTSIYRWQGTVETGQEVVMIVKTTTTRADRVVAEIKRLHPYQMPAIVIVPVCGGNSDFLGWIATATNGA